MSCDFSLHCWTKVNIIIGLMWCQEWELNSSLTYYKMSYCNGSQETTLLLAAAKRCSSFVFGMFEMLFNYYVQNLFLAISILIMIHFDFQKMSNTHMFDMLHVFPGQSTFSSISLSLLVTNHPIFYKGWQFDKETTHSEFSGQRSKFIVHSCQKFCYQKSPEIFAPSSRVTLYTSIIFKLKINGQLSPGLYFTILFSNVQTFSLIVSYICHVNDLQMISGQYCSAYVI